MNVLNHELYWCDGCLRNSPLKRLKTCGACRIDRYCSATCQAIAWKGGHKKLCQKIVVQKNLLEGWIHTWNYLLRWITVCALDFHKRPENRHDYCLKVELRKTGSSDLGCAYEVLDGRIETRDAAEVARSERNSAGGGEGAQDRLYLTLLVRGEEGEHVDSAELVWSFPTPFHDSPERVEMLERCYIEVLKWVVANSKPRHVIRDSMATLRTVLLRELGLSPWMSHAGGAGDQNFGSGDPSRPV